MHPNTIRAWSDAGRLRYYRINSRGDRRYRLGDLQRFLAAAETADMPAAAATAHAAAGASGPSSAAETLAGATRPRDGGLDPLDAERHRLDLAVADGRSPG